MSETDNDPNVNVKSNVSSEVNIKRLGQQQKDILRFLYDNKDKVWQQVEIIESLYGEITDSRKASVSRSVNTLIEHGLVFERQRVLITPEDSPYITEPYWSYHRPRYGITELGEEFLKNDSRFPNYD